MENKQFKIPDNVANVDQMKGFAEAMTAFFEQLLILNKSLDTMAKDTKDIKDYFTLANGFQKDSKIMQEDLVEKLFEKMKEDKDDLKNKIIDNSAEIKIKIDNDLKLLSKSIFNKILGLMLASIGTVSTIIALLENYIMKSSVQQIIQEVIKQIK